jgi:hypothetical protein
MMSHTIMIILGSLQIKIICSVVLILHNYDNFRMSTNQNNL